MRSPSISISPPDGVSSPPIRFSSVVLPEPEGTHQRDEVAALDFQIDAMQHLHLLRAALVGLGDVAEGNEGGHCGGSLRFNAG